MATGVQLGLREQNKLTTRRALEDAALRLFARDGYDATTVEAIAAEVEVSPRTFFRYFAAKDEVFDMGWRERQPRLARLVASAPAGLGDLAAAGWALTEVAAEFETERDRVLLRLRAIETSATLRGRAFDSTVVWQTALSEELGRRRGSPAADLTARVCAAAAVAVWQAAIAEWLAGSGSLTAQLRLAFAELPG